MQIELTGIKVHGNVGQVELLECIVSALQVGVVSTRAFGDVHVGDQVGETVGFCRGKQ